MGLVGAGMGQRPLHPLPVELLFLTSQAYLPALPLGLPLPHPLLIAYLLAEVVLVGELSLNEGEGGRGWRINFFSVGISFLYCSCGAG